MRIKGTVLLAALAAAVVVVGLGSTASAAERSGPPAKPDPHVVTLAPTAQHERAAGGGGRSHDFTGDGVPDILARQYGRYLTVYENGGKFNGTATYPKATFINDGWNAFTWIGSADLNGDGFADVVATNSYGDMYVALHSGTFDGTRTLTGGLIYLGSGWNINDMVYVYDYNGDGFDDILARRAGTGDSYVYFNNGGTIGIGTLQAPALFMTGGQYDEYQGIADVDLDGSPDFIYQSGGYLIMIALNGNGYALLGTGWNTVNSVVFTDLDNDGIDDIIAKRNTDSALQAYRHTGMWSVDPNSNTAFGTYETPVVVGYNWYINDIIA